MSLHAEQNTKVSLGSFQIGLVLCGFSCLTGSIGYGKVPLMKAPFSSLITPLVVAIDNSKLSPIILDKNDKTTLIELNELGRLTLKKLLYEKMTPDEYLAKGLTWEEIGFLNYLGDMI